MGILGEEIDEFQPSIVEHSARLGRNVSLWAFAGIEVFGDVTFDGKLMERGLGALALAAAFEVMRRAEQSARQQSQSS